MKQLTLQDFDRAYEIMAHAFPKSELRQCDEMKKKFIDDEFLLFGLEEDNQIEGVILCWKTPSCVFLENFAVSEKLRGKGRGSTILSFIKEYFHHDVIVLEVEEPYDETSKRRIGFYKRNGWILSPYGYKQPPLCEEINEIPLLLMSYPNTMDKNIYERIKEELFRIVYQCEKRY